MMLSENFFSCISLLGMHVLNLLLINYVLNLNLFVLSGFVTKV